MFREYKSSSFDNNGFGSMSSTASTSLSNLSITSSTCSPKLIKNQRRSSHMCFSEKKVDFNDMFGDSSVNRRYSECLTANKSFSVFSEFTNSTSSICIYDVEDDDYFENYEYCQDNSEYKNHRPEKCGTSTKIYKPIENSLKTAQTNLYPNCDGKVWMRSCEKEIIEPLKGTVKGTIPLWLKGSLLRNGPGSLKVGDMTFNHLFDSSALLHRFGISDGNVTYQCRFIQTDTYKKNLAANRIVVTEFGTSSVPDPCHTIFQRVSAIFKPFDASDNAMISIYPFGDEFFAFTESPVIHKINPETLSTEKKLNVNDYIGIVSHTSHPHIMTDGTVYNLGMTVTKSGPHYNIICFPHGDSMFEDAYIVATIPSRWKFFPGYMHTFGMTDNYYVIVEQPLSVSVTEMIKKQIINQPMVSSFKWFPDKNTFIYLICRHSGELKHTFEAEAFFYLHIINCYEVDDHVVVDICCYRDPAMLDCMYVEALENMQSNPNYANMFRGKPLRFVLPINYHEKQLNKKPLKRSFSITNLFSKFNSRPTLKRSLSEHYDVKYSAISNNDENINSENLENIISWPNTEATAYIMPDSSIFCKPECLCDLGCETPRIHYESYLGKKYRYFYAISSDVDATNPGTLIKVDIEKRSRKTWCEHNCYPSEPIFVPSPYAKAEDDGVVLAAMVWGHADTNRVGIIILCATTWKEIGRCEFETPGPVPKCLHGWFAPS